MDGSNSVIQHSWAYQVSIAKASVFFFYFCLFIFTTLKLASSLLNQIEGELAQKMKKKFNCLITSNCNARLTT